MLDLVCKGSSPLPEAGSPFHTSHLVPSLTGLSVSLEPNEWTGINMGLVDPQREEDELPIIKAHDIRPSKC